MANAYISFFTAGNRSVEGGTMPVPRGAGMTTEIVPLSATSAVTQTAASATGDTAFVRIASETDAWVVSGASPVARPPTPGSTAPGWRVRAGQAVDMALEEGDRIAIVEAV